MRKSLPAWLLSFAIVLSCQRSSETGAPAVASAVAPTPDAGATAESPTFTLVADQRWTHEPRLFDTGQRTLLLTEDRARLVTRGQPLLNSLEITAELPEEGKRALWWAKGGGVQPFVLALPTAPMETGPDNMWLRLDGNHFTRLPIESYATSATAVGPGTVVIGLYYDPQGDPISLPAGNRTRAWLVPAQGETTVWRDWPNAITWNERGSEQVVWAIAARPRQAGLWLLRMPLKGKAAFYPIPNRQTCTGSNRYVVLKHDLESVSDSTVVVSLASTHAIACMQRGGRYQFTNADRRWRSVDADADTPNAQLISRDGTVFRIEGTAAVVASQGRERRLQLPGIEGTGCGDPSAHNCELKLLTVAGDIWIIAKVGARSLLYRYE